MLNMYIIIYRVRVLVCLRIVCFKDKWFKCKIILF